MNFSKRPIFRSLRIALGFLLLFVPAEYLFSQHNKLSLVPCPLRLQKDTSLSIDIPNAKYSIPSPDGKKLLISSKRHLGLWILDIHSGRVMEISNGKSAGYKANWDGLKNNTITYQEVVDNKRVEKVGFISDKSGLSHTQANQSKSIDIQLKYNIKTRMVEARSDKTNSIWNVTAAPGLYYRFVISPDSTKVLIHQNDGKMYIYDLFGGGLLREIGYGICKSWSPDGKYLIYFIDEDLGQDHTVKSDIYICNSNGDKHWNLTKSDNKIEMWPHWSKNSNVISYYEKTENSIHVAEIANIEIQ